MTVSSYLVTVNGHLHTRVKSSHTKTLPKVQIYLEPPHCHLILVQLEYKIRKEIKEDRNF